MRFHLTRSLITALLCATFALVASAQTPAIDFPAASPACSIKQRVGLTDIDVAYSRPGVKGRSIFGGIVPYGKVWRTGANQATRVTFNTPVKLEGNEVPAGTYALFTIPGEDQWTVILSKKIDQWGAYQYDAKDDLLRFQVKPLGMEEHIDTFTIEFNQIRDDSALLNLVWDQTVVPVRIEVDVVGKVVAQIDAAMASAGKKSDGLYFQAATFYYDHNLSLDKALEWVKAGLADNPNIAFELMHLEAAILAKQGDKAGAIAAAKKSTELALKAEGPGSSTEWMNNQLISQLQQ